MCASCVNLFDLVCVDSVVVIVYLVYWYFCCETCKIINEVLIQLRIGVNCCDL